MFYWLTGSRVIENSNQTKQRRTRKKCAARKYDRRFPFYRKNGGLFSSGTLVEDLRLQPCSEVLPVLTQRMMMENTGVSLIHILKRLD